MITIELVYNLSLLVAISVISGFIDNRWKRASLTGAVLQGVLFGGAALVGMLRPLVIEQGLIFDGRSVVLSLCGLFFGPISAAIAGSMAIMLRLIIGGSGAIMGVSVIVSSCFIGVLFNLWRRNKFLELSWLNLYALGVVVHIVMVALMFTLPWEKVSDTIFNVGPPVLIFYPLTTLLIGKILSDQENAQKSMLALKKSQALYHDLVETSHNLIWQCDAERRYIYLNPSWESVLGYSLDEMIGRKFTDFQDLTHSERDIEVFNKLLSGSSIEGHETEHIHKSERKVNLVFYAKTVFDEEGNPSGTRGTAYDITERKKSETELLKAKEKAEEMNRLKTNLLANMSHDLRTPLVGMLGFSELLKTELTGEHKEFAVMINQSGLRLLKTLNAILSYSKLESEKIEVVLSNVRIADIVKDEIELFKPLAAQRSLYIESDIQCENLILKTDDKLIREIIDNLLNNAIKYTLKGGVAISLYTKNKTAIIKVTDTGIGIPKDKLEVIFEEFRQVSEGRARSFEGTGLGLTLAKKYSEYIGGNIHADSVEGVGSTFFVELPILNDRLFITFNIERPKNINKKMKNNREKLKVLLVEDEKLNSAVALKMLEKEYDVTLARTASEAIQLSAENKFDIALMDINLGGEMNGIEAMNEIKKNESYKNVPFIAMTAYAMPGDKEEFLSSGFLYYLPKPFSQAEILSLLREVEYQSEY